ncbi:MAG: copper chaperone PCu(A)C [Woeseiaceae bacterium]|jgi:copper(I)-binding protein
MKRFALLLALLAAACSNESPPLTITDVVIKKPLPGMHMSAGYFTMTNNSSTTIIITSVSSPQFGAVDMHETVIEDDVARMVGIDELELEPRASIEFAPGGKHLMLMRPVGELSQVTLQFYSGDLEILSVNVTVSE